MSKSKLVAMCIVIGCGGVDPKTCPGNPDCEMLQDLMRKGTTSD